MNSILPAMVPRPVQPGAGAGEDVQRGAAGVQLLFEQHEQFLHRPRDPVRLVDHQGVAGRQGGR
jgi:hypothetical protein